MPELGIEFERIIDSLLRNDFCVSGLTARSAITLRWRQLRSFPRESSPSRKIEVLNSMRDNNCSGKLNRCYNLRKLSAAWFISYWDTTKTFACWESFALF